MFCDVCKSKEATVFLTQIVEGKMQKVNLCEACSKEKGVNDPTGFALADLLLGLGAAQEIEKNPLGIRCPVCGFSQTDFKKTGRLGCSACYDAFSEGLSGMLKNMHRGLIHTGKIPSRLALTLIKDRELVSLQQGLEKAILEEKFEEAANFRDKIRSLESEGNRVEEGTQAVSEADPLSEQNRLSLIPKIEASPSPKSKKKP